MIRFVNDETGQTREVKDGFSFTVLFFGPWALLFRGQWEIALLLIIVAYVLNFLFFGIGGLFISLARILYAFEANNSLQKKLLNKGYRIVEDAPSTKIIT